MPVDPELLEILACPNCKTPVTLVKKGTALKCDTCKSVGTKEPHEVSLGNAHQRLDSEDNQNRQRESKKARQDRPMEERRGRNVSLAAAACVSRRRMTAAST